MELLLIITVLCYLISSGIYVAYLFFQKEALHKWGYYLLVGGFVFQTVSIVSTAVRIGSLPAHNLHQNLILAAWAVIGVFLLFRLRYHLKILGIFAAPLASAAMIAALMAPREPVQLQRIFNNFWLVIHVISIFIGEAAFALACGLGIFYILQENAIKNKRRGFFSNAFRALSCWMQAGMPAWLSVLDAHPGLYHGFCLRSAGRGDSGAGTPKRYGRNHLAALRGHAPRQTDHRVAGQKGRGDGDHRICLSAVYLFRRQFSFTGPPWRIYPLVGVLNQVHGTMPQRLLPSPKPDSTTRNAMLEIIAGAQPANSAVEIRECLAFPG